MLGCKYETRRIHLEIVFFVSIFLHFSGNFRLRLILMVLSLCFTIDFISLCSDLFAFWDVLYSIHYLTVLLLSYQRPPIPTNTQGLQDRMKGFMLKVCPFVSVAFY